MPFFYAQKQGNFKFQISNFKDDTLIIKLLRLEISDFKANGLKSDSLALKSEI